MTKSLFQTVIEAPKNLFYIVLIIFLIVAIIKLVLSPMSGFSSFLGNLAGFFGKMSPQPKEALIVVMVILVGWVFWLFIQFGRRLSERGYLGPLARDAIARADIVRQEDTLREDLRAGVFGAEIDEKGKDFRTSYRIPKEAEAPPLVPGVAIDFAGIPYIEQYHREDWETILGEQEILILDYERPTWRRDIEKYMYKLDGFSAEILWKECENAMEHKGNLEIEAIRQEINRRFFEGFQKEQINIFYQELNTARTEAYSRAETLLPRMDVSVVGGGWVFVLEFTTIIFIVFAALSLGLLDKLESDQIGTILAAIA